MNARTQWGAAVALAVGAHVALIGGALASRGLVDGDDAAPPMVLVDLVVPEPPPELEPIVASEPEPEVDAAVAELPPEPEPAEVAAEREPTAEPEPAPEPEPASEPEPVELAAAEPEPSEPSEPPPAEPVDAPADPVEPLAIGLQGSSFATGDAGGPVFARGDSVRGARPSRTSGHADRPAGSSTASPDPAPSSVAPVVDDAPEEGRRRGRRARRENRDARLARGVDSDVPYPDEARRDGVETDCVLRLRVDASGVITEVVSVRCDDDGYGFEDTVRAHVLREFAFEPAVEDGEAVASQVRWVHQFRIDS